ncbi:recombination regulator RecX [Undibacterium flavidum]|uniref:Regulatory protein RecX n=1 Tax=Undibacterium flavidum TaxID=2762297 RepID=A0ABR6Y8J8_9BURK|nr:recombination regulator RecX [Undibacterium flavidum]MBC3872927.1 recombination regulator RecX [Undibacterium flavidum]
MIRPKLSLKARALRFLSMREHSRIELARKLSPYVEEVDELNTLLNWLEESKFLSDQRFSESLVHKRQGRFGNQKILAELQSHNLSKDDLTDIKLELQETEMQRAVDVLWRKFRESPVDQREKAKQMQFLAQRGFSSRAISHALRQSRDVDQE